MSAADRARVVLADDHPGVRDAVTAMLRESFDVVAVVNDGAAAIEAVLRLRPDVVVLDVAMPGLDGFQTASRIFASDAAVRIVFLSDYIADDFVLAGVSRGASAFVAKLHVRRDLVDAVRHALAGRAFVPSTGVLPRWRRPQGRRHDLQIYTGDAFLIDAVVAYFEHALEEGHSIVAFATGPHLEALDAQLTTRGIDTAGLSASGRLLTSDAESALEGVLRNGMPDRTRWADAVDPLLERALAAARSSPPHVSLFGEIAPILCARGEFDAMLHLERIADEFAASRPISVLCGYSTACLSEFVSLPASICSLHATIVPADSNP